MNDTISFVKMHGLGNDFVVIDNRRNATNWQEKINFFTNRQTGIGCDQLIVIEKGSSDYDAKMVIVNYDGSFAKACGNAMRCVARYLFDRDMTSKSEIILNTIAGNLLLKRLTAKEFKGNDFSNYKTNGHEFLYQVQLASPKFDWQDIPITKEIEFNKIDIERDLKLKLPFQFSTEACLANTGNPHLVLFLENSNLIKKIKVDRHTNSDQEQLALVDLLTNIQHNRLFSESVNISLAFVKNRKEVELRVFERGVGFTLACGSAAAAVCSVGSKIDLIDSEICINFNLGSLFVSYYDNLLTITGDADYVFSGEKL